MIKILLRNKIHERDRSYDLTILSIGKKKLKLTYESYNAAEHYSCCLFDGEKWNHLLNMYDLGVQPNSSSYIDKKEIREKRVDELYKKAIELINTILK